MISSTFTNCVIVIFNNNSGLNYISRFNEIIAFEYHIILKPVKDNWFILIQKRQSPIYQNKTKY